MAPRVRSNIGLIDFSEEKSAVVCGEEPLLVFSGEQRKVAAALFSALQSTTCFQDELEKLDHRERFHARELLEFLKVEGAVVDDEAPPQSDADRFLDTTVGRWASNEASTHSVLISGDSAITRLLKSILGELKYEIIENGNGFVDCSIAVVDCNSVGLDVARTLNEQALKESKCVIYTYRPTLFETVIGPLVIPGVTPCFECFCGRWMSNGSSISRAVLENADGGSELRGPDAISHTVAGLVSMEIIAHLEHFTVPSTWNGILLANHRTGSSKRHHLLRLPNCAKCAGNSVKWTKYVP